MARCLVKFALYLILASGLACAREVRDDVLDVKRLYEFSQRINECGRVVGALAAPLIADAKNVDSLHGLRSWPDNNPGESLSTIAFLVRSETTDLGGMDSISDESARVLERKLGASAEKVVELPGGECRGVFHELLGDVLYRELYPPDSRLMSDLRLLGFGDAYYAKRVIFHLLFASDVSID